MGIAKISIITKKKHFINSNSWLKKRSKDKYFKQAYKQGLRSRAWFKLDEIHKIDRLFQPGMTVIDLGAAPGGWSKYVTTQIGEKGNVIAFDILAMKPIAGVTFLQVDICETSTVKKILKLLDKQKVQVVLSDMAPNISGEPTIDLPKSIYLAELALDICKYTLSLNGNFLVKLFYGDGFDEYLQKISFLFTEIKIRKPNASRKRSREVYIVAKGYKLL